MGNWTSWVLASAVLLALYDIVKKASVNANAVLPVLLASTTFGFAAYSVGLFVTGHFCAPSEISGAVLSLGLAKSVIVGTSWVFTFCALRTLPITIATPIRASSPALVLLIAIPLYGEMPSVLQGVGMAAVFTGYFAFSWAGRHEGIDFFRNRAVWCAIAGAVFSAISSIWDKYVFQVRSLPVEQVQLVFQAGLVAFYALALVASRALRLGRDAFEWRWTIPFVGILLAGADWLYFKGLAYPGAPISAASLMRRFSVVLTFLLGARFFHETNLVRKGLALAAIVAGVVLLCLAGGNLDDWGKKDWNRLTGLVYDQAKGLQYDVFIPKNAKKGADVPLMLFIHGGAWQSGRRQDMAYACKYYANNGCITATLDYSLVSPKRPEVTIYTMLDEITRCIGALNGELAKRGYRTPKIALGGFSAGGHLALLYSYSRAGESPIPIAFVCEKVGPSDFGEKAFGRKISAQLVSGGSGKEVMVADLEKPEVRKLRDSLSPVAFVTGKSVPTIFAYGGKDNLVKRYHRDVLAEALKKNGVAHVEVDFPNSQHGMCSDPEKTEEFRKAVLKYCQTYMGKGD